MFMQLVQHSATAGRSATANFFESQPRHIYGGHLSRVTRPHLEFSDMFHAGDLTYRYFVYTVVD